MRNKQRTMPVIEELPVVAVGFVIATATMATASALLWTVRTALRITGADRARRATHPAA